jgi:hypothetical protein
LSGTWIVKKYFLSNLKPKHVSLNLTRNGLYLGQKFISPSLNFLAGRIQLRANSDYFRQVRKAELVYFTSPLAENCHAVYGVGLRPLACWGRGFESHREHGRLSVVSVVCFEVEGPAKS